MRPFRRRKTPQAQTVRVWGVDAYSGFVLNAGHTAAGWLPLATGETPLEITVIGGDATATAQHYTQLA